MKKEEEHEGGMITVRPWYGGVGSTTDDAAGYSATMHDHH